jgi:hypothetical protein
MEEKLKEVIRQLTLTQIANTKDFTYEVKDGKMMVQINIEWCMEDLHKMLISGLL